MPITNYYSVLLFCWNFNIRSLKNILCFLSGGFLLSPTCTFLNAQSLCFSAPDLYWSGGNQIYGAIAADFNGDSLVDLVTTNSTSNNISIMPGDGAGNFGAPVNYATGSVPNGITSNDFNNDGNLDLAVANQMGGDISILPGNGNGTFNPAMNISIGSPSYELLSCDFDNDTIIDLAVAGSGGNVLILKGDGTGNFSVLNNYSAGAWPGSIAIADIDNDGIQDIAVPGGFNYTIVILPGLGSGNFAAPVAIPVSKRAFYLAAADLNNDSLPDIVTANLSDTSIAVYINTGNFSLGSPAYYSEAPNYLAPQFLTLADFNNDSIADILVSYATSNGISVFPGTGNGTFSAGQHFLGANQGEVAIAADLNQDGRTDIIHAGGPDYYVLLNCTPLGVVETPGQTADVKIYPTIVTDFFMLAIRNITFPPLRTEIFVYDQSGKLAWRYADIDWQLTNENTYAARLNCPTLPAGSYYINIITALMNEKEKRHILNGKIIII